MVHRAVVQVNTAAGTDAWNQPVAAEYQDGRIIPLYGWHRARTKIADDGKVVRISEIRAIAPPDETELEGSRLKAIVDRRGDVVIAGPLAILTAVPRRTHVELVLERI